MIQRVEVVANLLSANDRLAAANRAGLDEAGLFAINVLASPGAGKTTLIERTVRALAPDLRLAVIDGDHGLAVLGARGELGFEIEVPSDVAPLNHLIAAMFAASRAIHLLRDPTRGGLATTLNEIAQQSQVAIVMEENRIPVRPAVAAACELLGFDPLYGANEGKLVAMVAAEAANAVLDTMRATRYGEDAVIIGEVQPAPAGRVLLHTGLGSHRVVDVLMGELLPRIC